MANDFASDPSCKALWNFENDAVDSKGNNDLAAVNTPTYDGTEKKEGSYSTNLVASSNQYFKITDANLDAGFPIKSGERGILSICFWVYPTAASLAEGVVLVGKCVYSDSSGFGVLLNGTYQLGCQWGGMGDLSCSLQLYQNVWQHVTVLADGVNNTLYARVWDAVHGLRTSTPTITSTTWALSGEFRVGAWNDRGDKTADVKIDELVIFDRLITVSEIEAIQHGWFGVAETSGPNDFSGDSDCKAVWGFNGSGDDLQNTNHLAPVNSPDYDGSDKQEGGRSVILDGNFIQFFSIADSALSAGFPFKVGDSTLKISTCMWIKPAASQTADWIGLLGKIDLNTTRFGIQLYQTASLGVYFAWAGVGDINLSITLTPEVWAHISMVADAGASPKTLYVRVWDATNGVRTYNNTNISSFTADLNRNWTVGAYTDRGDKGFNGKIDEVVVFNRLLSLADIESIQAGTYIVPAGGGNPGAFFQLF